MSDKTITCGELEAKLADYLDGTIGDADRALVEAHLATCVSCTANLATLDEPNAKAAALPALSPSRDLWSGIAERIEPRVLPLGGKASRWTPERKRSFRQGAGMLALVAASVMLTVVVIHKKPGLMAYFFKPAPVVSPATSPLAPVPGDPNKIVVGWVPSKRIRAYDATIAVLDSAVNARQSQLDTATIRIIKKNLLVIDSAIAESRAALAKDPKNKFLTQQLTRILDQKVGLLRTAALLPART